MAIAEHLAQEGFSVVSPNDAAALIGALASGPATPILSLADYRRLLAGLKLEPAGDLADDAPDGWFRARIVRAGNLVIAVQPDRGRAATRKIDYHDATLPPRHGYVAFYLWLRAVERVHAVIHCGTHGTLEWLPGKATALSERCAPRAVLGPTPLIYPFIVNNPGEAAQAKRRTAAVTIGHLTPPLTGAGTHDDAGALEALLDEYAQAQSLDHAEPNGLAELIMDQARETGLAAESGVTPDEDAQAALPKLDAFLCDIKDMRIGDGLHVFGRGACGEAEMRGLVAALDGRFVAPGPAGAPERGRGDVLPTGRNLFSIDPRAVPTRTAWRSGDAPPTPFLHATPRTMASGPGVSCSICGAAPRCAPAATTWRRRSPCWGAGRRGIRRPRGSPASTSCRWRRWAGRVWTSPCAFRGSSGMCSRPRSHCSTTLCGRSPPWTKRRRTTRSPARPPAGFSAPRRAPTGSGCPTFWPAATGHATNWAAPI